MSSLLLPFALESCQTSLRERRRSSINTLNAIPRLFSTGHSSTQEGSAISDDNDISETVLTATAVVIPPLATLTYAQLPDHASKITIPRHFESLPVLNTYDVTSPSSSSPPTAMNSRKASFMTISDESDHIPCIEKMERLRWRLASGFFAYFLCGWGDGVTGTVLPHFMAEFNISYTMSSLLYAGSTLGFMFGTSLVEWIMNYLGRFDLLKTHWSWIPESSFVGRFCSRRRSQKNIGYSPTQARLIALLLSSTLHGMFFVMMGSRGGFWVLFFAYALAAFARSILTASLNAYFASGYQQSLGYAFGLWSLGGVASPMVCQAILSMGIPWFQFYFGSLVLSGLNIAFLVITFRPTAQEFQRDRENALTAATKATKDKLSSEANSAIVDPESPSSDGIDISKNKKTLHLALSLPYQWALCVFSLIYCGCETATQSFMVSYLLGVRNANPNTAGYVTSGFWGGITIGRFLWGHFTPKLSYTQRKWVIEGCIHPQRMQLVSFTTKVLGLTMQILIWTINSTVQNALATSIVGLVYGPVFPAILSLANDILPAEIRMVSMALISATASLGAALFPFLAGIFSSSQGVHTLMYITVPLAGATSLLWALFPSRIPSPRNSA